MRKRLIAAILATLCAGALPGPAGAELVLAENGVSRAPVVVFAGAPPMIRRAADELAGYLEKVTGARPPVLEGRPDPLPESAIWVGCQPVLAELFPGLDFDFKHPEEILIAANENHLLIAGRDRWHPDHLVVPGRDAVINGKQQEYGTVNAVYTFLRDYLDVRWLWPGETGEDILRKDTVAFAPFEYRYHPQFRQRCSIFRLSAPGDGRGISHDWLRFQRLQLDSLELPGGHAFDDWWARYHETHPDYFALQPDGTRSAFPNPGNAKLCQANPAVWEQWLAGVAEQLATDPTRTVFHAAFNDSSVSGHCICENCRAWDNLAAPPRRLSWQGLTQVYVALADRDVTFANTLARKLRERYPERDYHVSILAYGPSEPAPVAALPDDSVIIGNVGNFLQGIEARDRFALDEGKTLAQQFADWGKIGARQVWRPNAGSQGGLFQGQLDVPFGRVMDSFRHVGEHNALGIYIDTIFEYWPTQAPLYYLMAQLAWNPAADGRAELDDWYRRGFGPAAGELKAYWTLLEETRNRKVDGNLPWAEAYDEALFKRAGDLLDQADARLSGSPEIYRRRVAFMRAGLEFNRLMVDTRVLMDRWRAGQGADTAAADRVRANWEQMQRIARDNLMRTTTLRPGDRFVAGLHPDHP